MAQHHTDSNTKEIWYATNSSGSWTFLQITNNTVREEFPHLQLDSQGNVHIAFHTGTTTSNMIRYVNNVGAPAGSFNPIIEITGSGYVIVKHALDSTGRVHFTFRSQTTNSTDEIFYTSWHADTGVGPLLNISNSPGSESSPDLTVGPDDVVHIAWYDGTFSGPLVYVNNRNGSFQQVSTGVSSTATLNPIVLVSQQNVVSIIYRIGDFLYAIDDGGQGTFTTPVPVFTGSFRPSFYNRFAIDAEGKRYVAFVSNVGDNRGAYFIPETDKGFDAPIQLFASASGNQGASVALNSKGSFAVTYQYGAVNPNTNLVFSNIFVATAMKSPPVPCPADTNGDNVVNVSDLLAVISSWGPCANPNKCPADINDDGVVNVSDLLAVISAWGACPQP
jgi:hypothetical protein